MAEEAEQLLDQAEEVYTDDEASEALDYIRKHQLPMTDLKYALKYVRLLHEAATMNEHLKGIKPPAEIGQMDEMVAYVEPPAFQWEDMENKPGI